MVIAIESLLFLLAGIVLAVILTRVFGRQTAGQPSVTSQPAVTLVRSARTAEGREETRLLLNGQVLLNASNDGVRLAEYADEVEQLEALAARLGEALNVGVEFERVGPRSPGHDNGLMVRDLPEISKDEIETEERRRRLNHEQDAA